MATAPPAPEPLVCADEPQPACAPMFPAPSLNPHHARGRARLEAHARIWADRPLVQEIYRGYHKLIDAARSDAAGVDVEIGAGHGSFADYRPETILCDVVPCPWLDCAADAGRLPFADSSLANLIMVDVLHHVKRPDLFLSEAARTLVPGGRIVLLEPYCSTLSGLAYRLFHEEDVWSSARPLEGQAISPDLDGDDPWVSNIAVPTLLFWRDRGAFRRRFPSLAIVKRRRFDFVLYPLSGGFEGRRLIPMSLVPIARIAERLFTPLAGLLAFRCLIVVEKSAD